MIPEPDADLDEETAGRWNLTKMAAALVRAGVPVALVMSDCREGCDLADRAIAASGSATPARSDRSVTEASRHEARRTSEAAMHLSKSADEAVEQ